MIKKYTQFIKESDEIDFSEKYTELKEGIKTLIENTIENMGGEYNTFLNEFVRNPDEYSIEGLINDSDVIEFYLKYNTDIDELLNDIKFYDEVPSVINAYGLYSYTIIGTKRAVLEACKMMLE